MHGGTRGASKRGAAQVGHKMVLGAPSSFFKRTTLQALNSSKDKREGVNAG